MEGAKQSFGDNVLDSSFSFDRGDDGGDECEMNLAKSAAFVRDAKPESDVHSNFQNKGPLWKTMVSKFECLNLGHLGNLTPAGSGQDPIGLTPTEGASPRQ